MTFVKWIRELEVSNKSEGPAQQQTINHVALFSTQIRTMLFMACKNPILGCSIVPALYRSADAHSNSSTTSQGWHYGLTCPETVTFHPILCEAVDVSITKVLSRTFNLRWWSGNKRSCNKSSFLGFLLRSSSSVLLKAVRIEMLERLHAARLS